MKSILMSIKPKWVEKIASGEKTVEVRKSVPKLEVPFKVYMYCTKDREDSLLQGANLPMHSKSRDYNNIQIYACNEWWAKDHRDKMNGKVVGEFVCDEIENIDIPYPAWDKSYLNPVLDKSCLTYEELHNYGGSGKRVFGLHISDLKIYDKPKELSEFYSVKAIRGYHKQHETKIERLMHAKRVEVTNVTRPPQSWCYVEEV